MFDYKKTLEFEHANDSSLDYSFTSFSLDKENIYLLGKQEGGPYHGQVDKLVDIVRSTFDIESRSIIVHNLLPTKFNLLCIMY